MININNNNNEDPWRTFSGLSEEETDNLALIACRAMKRRDVKTLAMDAFTSVSPEKRQACLRACKIQKKMDEHHWLLKGGWEKDVQTLLQKLEREDQNFQHYKTVSKVKSFLKWELLSFVQINTDFQKGIGILNLHGLGLTCLPSLALKWFSDIDELDISNNNLKTLPKELGQLENLERVDISCNPIGELPPNLPQTLDICISEDQEGLVSEQGNLSFIVVDSDDELYHKEPSK